MCLTTLELDCWPTNQSLLSPNQLGQLRKSAFSFESIDGMVSNIQKNLYPFDLPPPIQFRAPYPIVLFTTVTIPLFDYRIGQSTNCGTHRTNKYISISIHVKFYELWKYTRISEGGGEVVRTFFTTEKLLNRFLSPKHAVNLGFHGQCGRSGLGLDGRGWWGGFLCQIGVRRRQIVHIKLAGDLLHQGLTFRIRNLDVIRHFSKRRFQNVNASNNNLVTVRERERDSWAERDVGICETNRGVIQAWGSRREAGGSVKLKKKGFSPGSPVFKGDGRQGLLQFTCFVICFVLLILEKMH